MTTSTTSDALVQAFTAASGQERDRLGRELLARYDKMVEAIVRDDAARAGVHVGTTEERAEVRNELRICLFEAAVSFNPERSLAEDGQGFEHWVRYNIANRLASLAGEEHAVEMPESWQRVARIASKVDELLTQRLRRSPTLDELRDGVLAHVQQWARERVAEAKPDLCGAALEAAVAEKLRKQGTTGAVEHLEDILVLRGRHDALPMEMDLAQCDREERAVDGVFAMLSAEERFVVEHRMGMFDGREWTFEEIAEELRRPWPEVRRTLTQALAKPKAPHAQYVYLAGIGAQIDDESRRSAVERMRARHVAR